MRFVFIPALFLSLLPLTAQEGGVEANKKIRATVQKWIAVMKETQKKQRDWREQKEILEGSKLSLQAERDQMEAEILAAFKRRESLAGDSKEKLDQKKSYDEGREALRDGLNDLDEKVSAVIPLLPETLTKISKVEKAIVDHKNFVIRKDKDAIGLNGRLTAMLTILTEAEKFNQVITPFQGLSAKAGGQDVLLDGVYFGLAMGFAANEQGTVALQLKPGPDGWTQTEISDPEVVGQIRELINVGNASGEMKLVTLPLEIAK